MGLANEGTLPSTSVSPQCVIEEWCTWRFLLFMIKTGALICKKLKLPLWNAHAVQNVQADENIICFICFETFLIWAFIGFCLLIIYTCSKKV